MSAKIVSTEDHKSGRFYVNVQIEGSRAIERFDSMMEAMKYLDAAKVSRGAEQVMISLKEVIITAKQALAYESCYAL